MITRTVRAQTMILALEMIRKDLGEEALVISVRQVLAGPSWQVWKKPEVEVMAVRLEEGEQYDKLQIQSKLASTGNDLTSEKKEISEISSRVIKEFNPPRIVETLQKKLGTDDLEGGKTISDILPGSGSPQPDMIRVVQSVPQLPQQMPVRLESPEVLKATLPEFIQSFDAPPLLTKIYHSLRHHGVDDKLLQRAIRICADSLNPRVLNEEKRVIESVQQQLEAVLRVQKEVLSLIPRVIFMTGTSGVGKTSIIAKLVVHFTVDLRQRVGWICADTVRIGALAEAKTYSDTIGIPLRVVYTPDELGQAIEVLRQEADYIFIDTPAFNPQNEASVLELGSLLTVFPRRSTWLVISATAKEVDLQNALAAVSPFKPRSLVVTKLDETNNFSALYNIAWRSQLPISYFTFGSKILNEIIPAQPELLVKAMFEERFVV